MINIVSVTYGTMCDVRDNLYLFYCFSIVYTCILFLNLTILYKSTTTSDLVTKCIHSFQWNTNLIGFDVRNCDDDFNISP